MITDVNLNQILYEHNIKPSPQRVAILEYLHTHRTHPSVDEIYDFLHVQYSTLSKTTIYNTLKLFVENGLSLFLTIDEKMVRFDGDVSAHAHFLCKKCSRVYDIMLKDNSLIGNDIKHNITETNIYFKGICEYCLKN